MSELLTAIDRLQSRRVLVLGDMILDRYVWGAADRVSPEAPTVVLRVDDIEVRLGGAAAVAGLLRGFGSMIVLAGVVGNDVSGRTLRKLLDEVGVDAEFVLVDPSRPTTTKERFMGRAPHRTPHQILRVDHEATNELAPELVDTLAMRLASEVTRCDALVISDYAKGTCSPVLLRIVIEAARNAPAVRSSSTQPGMPTMCIIVVPKLSSRTVWKPRPPAD